MAFAHYRTSLVMAAISSSNTAFALELLRTLSQVNPTGNIFVSPLSITSALAMVYLGAKGDTAAQMAKVDTLSLCYVYLLYHMTFRLNMWNSHKKRTYIMKCSHPALFP